MNTYYYIGDPEEIEAILRDGFIDTLERNDTGQRGVYVTDCPGTAASNPGKVILELTFPAQIYISRWKLVFPDCPAPWQEWLIPAILLNKHAKLRKLDDREWAQARLKEMVAAREELTAAGLLEHAKDSQGQLMYRNGKAVWRLSKKGRSISPEDLEAASKAARAFPPPPSPDSWS